MLIIGSKRQLEEMCKKHPNKWDLTAKFKHLTLLKFVFKGRFVLGCFRDP